MYIYKNICIYIYKVSKITSFFFQLHAYMVKLAQYILLCVC